MSPIKDLNVIYIAVNEDGTFSQGDIIVGAVIFRLTKDVKVKSVSLKAKGDASAEWSNGDTKFISHWRYFKVKKYLVEKNDKDTVLPQGVNTLFFMFKIPECDMPSSYKGKGGRIVYMFEAKISRSWRWSSEAQKEIKFVSKSCPPTAQLMCPQSGSVSKTISGLSKGQVQLSATINKGVCSPGETLSVVAKIHNFSSKDMRPKFKLLQRTVYRCKKHTNITYKILFKMVGDIIGPNSEQTASCQLKIPDDAIPTLHNCEIISVEYDIKVYLDISFSIDPEVVLPLVIVPSRRAPIRPGEAVGQSEDEAETAETTSYSNVSSPAFPTGFGSVSTDPTQPSNITSGNSSQWPQGAASLGFSTPTFTVPSVQQPGATAQPAFVQGEQSPLYTSIYHYQND
ncbi:arrestin domain-containing protein 3-like [Archocentrus centrarchus]|uniref:arrestin domain-containing protein 3-like n=1 Tax=Archocentrus centrarchus TaxID=63155 RepID=UPI0011EA2FCB|nr:arrestin domain-containing protein 3-like [Archocentrus centrarchus]